jgi:hypothetical protein
MSIHTIDRERMDDFPKQNRRKTRRVKPVIMIGVSN